MSDSTKKEDSKSGKLTLGGSTLTLGGNKDKASDSRGSSGGGSRSKSVNVQVQVKKKRRPLTPEELKKRSEEQAAKEAEQKKAPPEQHDDSSLTDNERSARMQALQLAEASRKAQGERLLRQDGVQRIQTKNEIEAEKEASKSRQSKKEEAEEAEEDTSKTEIKPQPDPESVKPIKASDKVQYNAPARTFKKDDGKEAKKPAPNKMRNDQKRRSGKLTITKVLSGENEEEKMRSLASVKRAREKARRAAMGEQLPKEKVAREVTVPEVITVQELANRMAERVVDVTKALMKLGQLATANQSIDADTAELVIEEFGHRIKRVTEADLENLILQEVTDVEESLIQRAPVVTFMGHVDHGKTSLLDAIRKAKVVEGEAGGITQHIGAYQVQTDDGHKITFLDTPGHEAFTEMRRRGATATDIVVLVVAADDGIMAQTKEAISHAKAAEVPIIVAVNKIDKPDADPARIRNELLSHDLIPEELGGDVMVVDVSAKQNLNLDQLLDAIMLQSEVMELKANPDRVMRGTIIESRVDKYKGALATVLVEKGSLTVGDIVLAGTTTGKVKAMNSSEGRKVQKAGPSVPVEVLGLNEAPEAGALVYVVETDKQARDVIDYRMRRDKELKIASEGRSSLDALFEQAASGGIKELPLVIRADVQGSVEAIVSSLEKLPNEEVAVRVLHSGVGGVSASDVSLAGASGAIVLAFNVRADQSTKEQAVQEGTDIRYYSIIYDLVDDMKGLLSGMLKPAIREKYLGSAEIRDVFNMTKAGKVAGCYVTDGIIKRGSGVRLVRDKVVIHEGSLKTLRRFKDDVKEVGANFECGMAFENYEDIKVGDQIEAFELIEEQRQL